MDDFVVKMMQIGCMICFFDIVLDFYYIIRDVILQFVLGIVVFDGWIVDSFVAVVKEFGVDVGLVYLVCLCEEFDLIIYWFNQMDVEVEKVIFDKDIVDMKVCDWVMFCVLVCLEVIGFNEEVVCCVCVCLLLLDVVIESVSLVWNSCDMVWWVIGDQLIDFNFYFKCVILFGVYGLIFSVWLGESDLEKLCVWEFFDYCIENVMQFEKVKWQFCKVIVNLFDFGFIFGKMCYGFGLWV